MLWQAIGFLYYQFLMSAVTGFVFGFVFAFISHNSGFFSMLDTVIDDVSLRLSVLWDFLVF